MKTTRPYKQQPGYPRKKALLQWFPKAVGVAGGVRVTFYTKQQARILPSPWSTQWRLASRVNTPPDHPRTGFWAKR